MLFRSVEVAACVSLGRNLLNLQRSQPFTHYAVAFDTVIESFRNQLFAGYKTGDDIDPFLFAQFPLAERLTRALGFAVLSMVEYEADDGLASAARMFVTHEQVERIVIASPDKDLMQLVDARVVTWDRLREKTYDVGAVIEKMGVKPKSIPDYLALVGDSADGIPGVPRWGARSSSLILAEYEHLEHIPSDPGDWKVKIRGARALADQLQKHRQEALLYRTLATLKSDIELSLGIEDMAYRGTRADELRVLEAELGVSMSR